MLSFTNIATKYPEFTYCYNVQPILPPTGGTVIKMSCPLLMSGMSSGSTTSAIGVNLNAPFINSSSCKPTIGSASAQSYIQFTCQYNSSFIHLIDGTGHIPTGTRFKCQLSNGLPILRSFSSDL